MLSILKTVGQEISNPGRPNFKLSRDKVVNVRLSGWVSL